MHCGCEEVESGANALVRKRTCTSEQERVRYRKPDPWLTGTVVGVGGSATTMTTTTSNKTHLVRME